MAETKMTWEEARTFFDRYSWLLFQERETGEQVPSDVREKLEEAYEVLKSGVKDEWKTYSK